MSALEAVGRRVARLPWRPLLLLLLLADAAYLAHAVREHRHAETLARLVGVGTPEAYAEAIGLAPERRALLLYNLGNLYLDDGSRRRFAASLRTALGYYREALRLEPGLWEAKHNYEVAWRVLERLVPPRPPREPRPPDRVSPSQLPLLPSDI